MTTKNISSRYLGITCCLLAGCVLGVSPLSLAKRQDGSSSSEEISYKKGRTNSYISQNKGRYSRYISDKKRQYYGHSHNNY